MRGLAVAAYPGKRSGEALGNTLPWISVEARVQVEGGNAKEEISGEA